MGKKASLRWDLDYDLEEEYDNDADDDYDYDCWVDDGEDTSIDEQNGKSFPNSSRTPISKVSSRKSTALARAKTIHGTFGNRMPSDLGSHSASSIKVYHKSTGRPIEHLILDHGYESILYHLASFLSIRSISALSCVNKRLEETLRHHTLYTKGSPLLIPCLKACPLSATIGNLATFSLSRALALESTLFQKTKTLSRERTLVEMGSIDQSGQVVFCRWSDGGSRLVYLSKQGKLVTHLMSSPKLNQQSREFQSMHPRELYKHDECLGILSSDTSGQLCSVVWMPATGIRRYTLTTSSIDFQRKIMWQLDIDHPKSVGATFTFGTSFHHRRPSIKFSTTGDSIILYFMHKFGVYEAQTGNCVWEHDLAKEFQNWHAWTVHDDFVVAITAKKRKIIIYSLTHKTLVACGTAPKRDGSSKNASMPSKPPQADPESKIPQIQIFDDRVWFTRYPHLYCTGGIFRRLQKFLGKFGSINTLTSSATPSRIQPLPIRKVHTVTALNNSKVLLQRHGPRLYLADGSLIKIFGGQLRSQNMDETRVLEPRQVLSAEGTVDFLQADSMKLVCGISDEKRCRIEVFLLPDLPTDRNTLYHSVFVKNAAVFCNRYRYQSIQFVRGRLLVSFRKTSEDSLSVSRSGFPYSTGLSSGCRSLGKSKIRIFHLFQDWQD